MTLSTEKQIQYIHIFLNISRSKDNQTMNFGLLIEYVVGKKKFSKKHGENEAGRLISDLILFFKKVLYEVKASG